MPKTTQGQYRVTVQGIPGTWNKSGGQMERSHENDFDGGSQVYDILMGLPTYSNLTLTRTKKTEDEAWLRQWRKRSPVRRANITVQELDENGDRVGKPQSWPDCPLVGLNEPDSEGGSSSAATLTLVFGTTGPAV